MKNDIQIKPTAVLGWDVGGAHLKAALVDATGSAIAVIQVPCPLWRGLHELEQAVEDVINQLEQSLAVQVTTDYEFGGHVVTMTGELADIFPHRQQGVEQISAQMLALLGEHTRFYAGNSGLVSADEVADYASEIASANWLASAELVSQRLPQGLFVDIGSTTADFVLFDQYQVIERGASDGERLQQEALVYSGVIRTPLMSLGKRVPFMGEWQTLAAEHFATTADVYRLTLDLNESEDMAETADGSGKSAEDSARRIARMIGRDVGDAPLSAWIALAEAFKHMQLNQLKDAVLRNLSYAQLETQASFAQAPLIGAGAGSFLVRELAAQLNRRYFDIDRLITGHNPEAKHWAGVCLPAYAVACIAAESFA
ncbi:MAG: S-layer protein [Methylophilaceae bacterium]|nr:S-layer protein [Methylophilaceae bacterium]